MAMTIQKKPQLPPKKKQKKLKFGEHLQELKNRFLIWFVVFVVASMVGYFLYQPLFTWLIVPLKGPLFYTSPVGALQAVFGVSAIFGFIVSLPVLLYELMRFFEPAFGEKPIKHILIYVLVSFTLAIIGVLTAYYLVLPATLGFLANFASGQLKALISTKDYFSFVTKYLLGFAILFQLPLVIYILGKFVSLQTKTLLKYWRHVIVLSFIISAILTPTPDPINQTIMAAPIIILYFISIAVLAFSKKLS
jgi:sec-independent protein translocase protein TatC